MKTIAVAQFKAHCLQLFEELRSKHEHFVVTKRGEPIAEIIPFRHHSQKERSELLGSILFEKDIISPLEESWDATK